MSEPEEILYADSNTKGKTPIPKQRQTGENGPNAGNIPQSLLMVYKAGRNFEHCQQGKVKP
ncbi:hypothetical protein L1766_09795 [Thermovorax subterraneus]|nr:hypothetical protein [Thermovorax subterraneus]